MQVLIQRRIATGLLILAMSLPGWGGHVCRCSRAAASLGKAPFCRATTSRPTRSCCAQRGLVKPALTDGPSIKARCCCDEVRWNEAAAKIAPLRGGPETLISPAVTGSSPFIRQIALFLGGNSRETVAERTGSLCIVLCRWQA
jgi:hypothetical protein